MRAHRNPAFPNLGSRVCKPAIRLLLGIFLIAATALPALGQTVVGTITRTGLVPTAVAVYEAGNKVFVADSSTGNLYMYNGTTLADLGSVNVGGPVGRMVVDETYGKLYATVGTTIGNAKVVVVDAVTGVFLGVVTLGTPCCYGTKYLLGYDPGLAKVYTVDLGSLYQIDVATDTTASVALDTAVYSAGSMAVNPVTHEVFIGPITWNVLLQVVDGNTLAKSTAPIGGTFCGLGVNWTENKVYHADCSGAGFTVLDRDTGSVSYIVAYNDATAFAFNPISNRMYTSSEINGILTIIEGPTDAFWNLGMFGTVGLGLRLSTGHVYYAGSRFIAVLDDPTQLVEMIPVINPAPSGVSIEQVAVNQTTGRVFVINDGNALNFVTVLQDTKELTRSPVYVAAVYTGPDSFRLHILDPLSKAVVSSNLSYAEYGLAVRPGGGRVYEATYGNYSVNGSIRIHTGVGYQAVLETFEDGGNDPTIPVVSPDGSRLYVTNATSADVSVVNTADNSIETVIAVGTTGSKPWGAAVTPDGAKVYVANRGNNTVHVISTASNTVSSTLPVGTAPWGVAVNPAGTRVYVANSGSNSVSVIDTASDTVIGTVYVGTTPHWLAVSPDGGRIYVTNRGADTVSVIESGGDTVIETVPVGSNPEGVAVMPDGSEVYVVNFNALSASSYR